LWAFPAQASDIEAVFRRAYMLMDYEKDAKSNSADLVRQGKRFKADCLGFALTCQTLLSDRESWIHYCATLGGRPHAVLECGGYILDIRYPGLRTVEQAKKGSGYTFHEFLPANAKAAGLNG